MLMVYSFAMCICNQSNQTHQFIEGFVCYGPHKMLVQCGLQKNLVFD